MFKHTHHERTLAHQNDEVQSVTVAHDQLGVNDKIALFVTKWVGSMYAAYLFVLFTLTGLPSAVKSGPYTIVGWTSSYFLQLVLLPIIMVGSNLIQKAMDRQNAENSQDIKALLHEILTVQEHLSHQDDKIEELLQSVMNPQMKLVENKEVAGLGLQWVHRDFNESPEGQIFSPRFLKFGEQSEGK